MATTISLYLDCRSVKDGRPAPMKLVISRNGKRAYLPLDVKVRADQWDATTKQVTGHPDAARLTTYLARKKIEADMALFALMDAEKLAGLTVDQLRDEITLKINPELMRRKEQENMFLARCILFMESKTNPRTYLVYQNTIRLLEKYDRRLSERTFEDIDRKYLLDLENAMLKDKLKQNTINLHLRNIRAIFNAAIDDDVTTAYPFRKIRIKPQATKDRSLGIEQLRAILNYEAEEWRQEYVDMFRLTFFLCGINIGDLCGLKESTSGRAEYIRMKTGKQYSIKIEPEALFIINRYRGRKNLLNILDRYANYHDYAKHFNAALKTLGMKFENGKPYSGKPLVEGLTTYFARYTWASIAAELDIPKETIAAGLGHSQNDVTSIYIRTDMRKKVDEANRKIIDYVLYGIDYREK